MALLREAHWGDVGMLQAPQPLHAPPEVGRVAPAGLGGSGRGRSSSHVDRKQKDSAGPRRFITSATGGASKPFAQRGEVSPGLAGSTRAEPVAGTSARRTTTEQGDIHHLDAARVDAAKTGVARPQPLPQSLPRYTKRGNREKECNLLLSQCTCPDDVFHVVDTQGSPLTTVNVVTAFYTLARLSKGLRAHQRAALQRDARLRRVAELARHKIPACGWRSLANLAWAETHLRSGGVSFYEAIAEAALKVPLERPPKEQELVALVSGFARCGVSAPALLDRVAELVQPRVAHFTGWQIAQLAWAFAKVQPRRAHPELWAALKEAALRQLDSLTPQSLSLLLWSLAEAGVADEACLDAIAAAVVVRAHEYSPVDISFTARAFAKLGRDYSHLMAALAERSKAVVHAFTPQNMAALIWSLAAAGFYDEALLRSLLAAHTRTLAALTPLEASNLLWGLAMLRFYDPPFLDAMAGAICERVADFEDTHIASVLFAYATFGAAGPPHFLPTLAEEVLRRLRRGADFKRGSLGNIAWGFMVLGCYPPALFAAMRPALYRSTFPAHAAAKLYQVELALRLEAPAIAAHHAGGDMRTVLDDLWRQGYAKHRAQLYWTKMNQGAHVVTSALQRAVHASLERLGVPCMEEFADAQYVIDIALPAQRIAVEVDGPHHYAANARDTPLGPTRLKHRLLRALGWRLITVRHTEWEALGSTEERDEHMRQRLGPLVRAAQEDAARQADAAMGQPPKEHIAPGSSDAPDGEDPEMRLREDAQSEILTRSEKLKMLAASRGKTGKIDMLRSAAIRRAMLPKSGTKDGDASANQSADT